MNARLALLAALFVTASLPAHERVTPKQSKGGEPQGEAWAEVPETFKAMKIPDWPLPTDRQRWEQTDRARTRATLLQCLGDLPPRPDPRAVRIVSREDKGDYILEHFEFYNGVDMVVPGLLALPKNRKGPAPVIVGMHGHSGSKNEYLPDPSNP